MIVLGIDIGFASLGWAIVDTTQNLVFRAGVIKTEKASKKVQIRSSEDNIKRAQVIHAHLQYIIENHTVELIATESMSWPRSAGVVAKMGIAWGVLASVAYQFGLNMVQSSPMELKRKVCGDGKASKERMIQAIKVSFPTMVWPKQETLHEHVADAVGAVLACKDSEFVKWAERTSH